MDMKIRADQMLVDKGLARDVKQAQALIMAGEVVSGSQRIDKPGMMLAATAPLRLKSREHDYVSRGGLKLAHGLDHFSIDPAGLACLDIGSSTGGFTDVLLRRGARHVFAVDAGFNQLDWSLRNNARVTVLEKTDARSLTLDIISAPPQIVVCDASFISLKAVLPAALGLAVAGAPLLALIKPQFEVDRSNLGEGGVVRDIELHTEVCDSIAHWLAEEMRWKVQGLTPSPITGAEGNVEFLICAYKP